MRTYLPALTLVEYSRFGGSERLLFESLRLFSHQYDNHARCTACKLVTLIHLFSSVFPFLFG